MSCLCSRLNVCVPSAVALSQKDSMILRSQAAANVKWKYLAARPQTSFGAFDPLC